MHYNTLIPAVFQLTQPSATVPKEVWKRSHQMPMRSGRLEKRTGLAIPVRICSLQEQEPTAAERTITENVCSLGIRVLASRPRELNERMLINSADGDLQTQARVIYCQPLADGRFAIGLEFPKETTMWVNKTLSYGN